MGGEVTLVSLSGVAVQFGARTLLQDVGFVIGRGERWGVLGRNGQPLGGASLEQQGTDLELLVQWQLSDFGDTHGGTLPTLFLQRNSGCWAKFCAAIRTCW